MKLKQLLEQLNQLAKERPEALEMEVKHKQYDQSIDYVFFVDIKEVKQEELKSVSCSPYGSAKKANLCLTIN